MLSQAERHEAAAGIARFDLSALADTVGRLGDAGLLSGGGVVVMNLDCVREALAERWDGKREQVWEHVERTLARELGPTTVVARAGEVDVLVAQPGVERLAAHSRSLRALREILAFFLGEVRPQDLSLRQVDGLEDGRLLCRPLDPSDDDIVAVETAPARRAPPRAGPPAYTYSVFSAVDGTSIRVTCAYDDLVALRNGEPAGRRLRPCVADVSGPDRLSVRLGGLDWRDAERVDFAVLQQAAGLLASLPPTRMCLAPVSFGALSSQRGRRNVVEQVHALAQDGRRVAVEIRDLKGVPASRLAEIVGLVRPHVFGVIGEIEADRTLIAGLAGCGLNGLSLRSLADWAADPRLVGHFGGLAALARRIAPICIARAHAPERTPVMREAGYTHAYLPPACAAHEAVAA